MNARKLLLACLCLPLVVFAPAPPLAAQPAPADLVRDLQWRNIGPANMSGRISDIEALDSDFTKVLVATASGGVFKSVNAGTTWEPIFDKYGSASIGDVAFFQKNPDIIWVGTGEECVRNSVAWGDGIYKSTDGGKTFVNMGLKDTQQHRPGCSPTRPIRTSSTWRPAATRGATPATAGCSRRSTAARPGRSSAAACRTTARRARSTW